MPKISVIMPVYNGLPYLNEAIESVINQTFQDWELLVVDDHSADGSPDVVKSYSAKDSRIKLLTNTTGIQGSGPSRNVGIDASKAEYIAIMDADDISLPKRLEEQIKFMEKHPDMVMSSCFERIFGKRKRVFISFTSDLMIKALYMFFPIMALHAIIFRREIVKARYPALRRGQDVVFCWEIIKRYRVGNLPKILYHYRVADTSFLYRPEWREWERKKLEVLLPMRLGFTPTPEQIDTHLAWERLDSSVSLARKLRWIMYIITHGKLKWYERPLIFFAYISYGILKKIYLMWFGK